MSDKKSLLKCILIIGDIILMYGALFLALAIRYGDFSFLPGPRTQAFIFHFSIIAIFWILLLFAFDFYEIPPLRKIFDVLRNLVIFIFLAGIFGVVYFYLKPQSVITPKTILVLDILIFSSFIFIWRYILNRVIKTRGFKEKIVIIGLSSQFKELISNYINQSNYEVVSFFDPAENITKLKEIIEKNRVDTIVFALDIHKDKELSQKIFSTLPLKLNYISFITFYETITKKVPLEDIDELWFLQNISQSKRRIYEISKRTFDIVFSFIGLLITIILFPFIALAIKIDSPGSIFYIHRRIGKNRKVFRHYKFRSMKETPDQYKEPWRERDPGQITMVGRFLRTTHLDEFPQFWGILKGDLSFVGPRPEWEKLSGIFEKEIPFYQQRYLVRPGFTGWAQIHYPASTSVEEAKEKFQYDLYYIKNRSFFLDLAILFKTIQLIFR
ncbi:exopolysaccharide biosynthesis polyprenyl glycosylphosphotransferase [Candidatus Parcubacteria bacterium]|nr:exopolysaccharide biosynthesis polyprenyl glycosylphosphotransferase [Candidatus Parcubacteria bacterium]